MRCLIFEYLDRCLPRPKLLPLLETDCFTHHSYSTMLNVIKDSRLFWQHEDPFRLDFSYFNFASIIYLNLLLPN